MKTACAEENALDTVTAFVGWWMCLSLQSDGMGLRGGPPARMLKGIAVVREMRSGRMMRCMVLDFCLGKMILWKTG